MPDDQVLDKIFRAYDIRGVYPEEINEEVIFSIVQAAVDFLRPAEIVVGRDGRISSAALHEAVVTAATALGVDVKDLGLTTTPVFYFAVKYLRSGGGIMITASHNPQQYNGLKLVDGNGMPIGQQNGLRQIKSLTGLSRQLSKTIGKVISAPELKEAYIERVIKESGLAAEEFDTNLVVDAGNGVGSLTFTTLLERLGIKSQPLFFDIDGSFPNRSPDSFLNSALDKLQQSMLQNSAQLGIALDGDADRIVFLDENAQVVSPQYILALLWQEDKKQKIVYDLRFSRVLKDLFGTNGEVSRVGHSFVQDAMTKHGASLGGELSGHFYFKDMYGGEAPELAFIKLLQILEKSPKTLSELVAPFQTTYYSGEINIAINQKAKSKKQSYKSKFKNMLEELKKKYSSGKINELDGLTVEYPDWWFNVRSSNTEPVLRLVVEAEQKGLGIKKLAELTQTLTELGK